MSRPTSIDGNESGRRADLAGGEVARGEDTKRIELAKSRKDLRKEHVEVALQECLRSELHYKAFC